jgi:hypothetical protein
MALSEKEVFASAARTATEASADFLNSESAGAVVVIDVTAVTSTPSTVFTLQGKDQLSGKYYTIIASAALAATGTVVLRVYPGLTAAANLTVSDVLPHCWRVNAVHGNANSMTYTVALHYIP